MGFADPKRLEALGFSAVDDDNMISEVGGLSLHARAFEGSEFAVEATCQDPTRTAFKLLNPSASTEEIADVICRLHEELLGFRPEGWLARIVEARQPFTVFGGRDIRLADVAQIVEPTTLVRDGSSPENAQPARVIAAQCYVIDYQRLESSARERGEPWLRCLAERAIAALSEDRMELPALVGYVIDRSRCWLLLCSKQKQLATRLHGLLDEIALECRDCTIEAHHLRPIVYWEPPSTIAWLWPLPKDGRPGPFAVDAANLQSFRSYPESQHESGIPIDLAGPDYVRVPDEEHGEFTLGGQIYRYVNWWALID